MKCVVFVPGILGTELEDPANEQVWPPSPLEVIFGYDRIDDLLADDLTPVRIIRRVGIKGVYRTILDDIESCGYVVGGADRRFVPYPYDWRKSNAESAAGLAALLDGVADATEILLIGHSMGGLVLRYLLESGEFNDRPWFDAVSTLITLGTPHFGAPKALARLLGNESQLGVSGPDLVRLAGDPRYPSLYQLVPAPGSALTVPATDRGQIPTPLDSFSAEIAAALDLNADNVRSALEFWGKLSLTERAPPGIDYYLFGGGSHTTTVRNEWDAATGELAAIDRRQSGDGTVPMSSSIVPVLPHGFSDKKHVSIFDDRDLRMALYRFLDAPVGVRPQAADARATLFDDDAFGISVDKENYGIGDPIEIVASYNREVTDPSESFQILKVDPETGQRDPSHVPTVIQVDFGGVNLTSFSFVIAPELQTGFYQLLPTRALDDPEPTYFVVR